MHFLLRDLIKVIVTINENIDLKPKCLIKKIIIPIKK